VDPAARPEECHRGCEVDSPRGKGFHRARKEAPVMTQRRLFPRSLDRPKAELENLLEKARQSALGSQSRSGLRSAMLVGLATATLVVSGCARSPLPGPTGSSTPRPATTPRNAPTPPLSPTPADGAGSESQVESDRVAVPPYGAAPRTTDDLKPTQVLPQTPQESPD
jgi:hypothetical protein